MAQAKAKSNSVVTTAWELGKLRIDVIGAGTVVFDPQAASEANRAAAERHGWTQRLCDRAAKGRDPKTGAAAPPSAKFLAIKELADYYMGGEVPWKMVGGSDGGLLFEALCELKCDKTEDQIRKFLDSRSDDQLKELRKIPALVEIMNRLRVERMTPVDVEDALGDLDSME
jgi:hypothetical protein